MIKVKHGVNQIETVLSNVTVQDVFDAVQGLWNLADGLQARVNSSPASFESDVPDGALVEFVKVAGEKGLNS